MELRRWRWLFGRFSNMQYYCSSIRLMISHRQSSCARRRTHNVSCTSGAEHNGRVLDVPSMKSTENEWEREKATERDTKSSIPLNVAIMMMVSMHTRYNTSISPLLHVVRMQLHPLSMLSFRLLLRIIITFGIKLTVTEFYSNCLLSKHTLTRAHSIAWSKIRTRLIKLHKKCLKFAELLIQLWISFLPWIFRTCNELWHSICLRNKHNFGRSILSVWLAPKTADLFATA